MGFNSINHTGKQLKNRSMCYQSTMTGCWLLCFFLFKKKHCHSTSSTVQTEHDKTTALFRQSQATKCEGEEVWFLLRSNWQRQKQNVVLHCMLHCMMMKFRSNIALIHFSCNKDTLLFKRKNYSHEPP